MYDQDGLPVSHKPETGRHGFGMKSIQKVVKQYHGNLQMYYEHDSATFHTIITLKPFVNIGFSVFTMRDTELKITWPCMCS